MAPSRPLRLVAPTDTVPDVPETNGALALKPYPCESRAAPACPAPAAARPDPAASADRILWLAAEAFAGRRPFHQLARHATAELADLLTRRRHPAIPTRPGPPRVRHRRVQLPTPGVAEVTATVVIGGRIQPMALRLILLRGRWLCTALETAVPT